MALGAKVNVRKLKNHPHYKWIATFKEEGQVRKKYFVKKADADDWKENRETEALDSGTKHGLTDEERGAIIDAREALSGLDLSLRDAIAHAVNHHKQIRRSAPISKLVDEFIETKEREGRSERYLADIRSRLGRFRNDYGDKIVATVQSTLISDWLVELKLKPVTTNNYRRLLVGLFNEGRRRRYINYNPALDSIKIKEVPGSVGILTAEETSKLLSSADDEILPFFAIGLYAGVRTEELERLDWRNIDLLGNHIEIKAENAKSAKRRLILIRPNLKAWLQPFAKASGKVWPKSGRKLSEKARRQAGFGNPDSLTPDEKKAGLKLKPWPHNAMRHSFGSYHLAAFNDASKLALEMGHTDNKMIFAHYREVVRPVEAKKYWSIQPGKKVIKMRA